MLDSIIWICTYCGITPSAQSTRICSRCRRKLTSWDPSKTPIERQPEWKSATDAKNAIPKKNKDYIDYTVFLTKTRMISDWGRGFMI